MASRLRLLIGFFAAWSLACVLFAAVPGVSLPTDIQALWVSGFAKSLANGGPFELVAHDIGLPEGARMAFGLTGARVQAWVIQLTNLHPLDAYSVMSALFLGLALWGAFRAARDLKLSVWLSLAMGTVWVTTPLVWMHAGFSLLAHGFSFLPLYFHVGFRLLAAHSDTRSFFRSAALFAGVAVFAAFTEGYTFLMGVAVWGAQLLFHGLRRDLPGARILMRDCAMMALGIYLAGGLYSWFAKPAYAVESLGFFRAFSMDLKTFLVPSSGLFWFWDAIGFHEPRTVNGVLRVHGDASVLTVTFGLMLALLGFAGYVAARKDGSVRAPALCAAAGLWLALGPNVKFGEYRSESSMREKPNEFTLEASPDTPPTGTGWLSEHVPGFKLMRAPYRWMGLSLLGFWALTCLLVRRLQRVGGLPGASAAWGAVALAMLPNFPKSPVAGLQRGRDARRNLIAMDQDLIQPLRQRIGAGKRVLWAPHGNDFTAGYASVMAGLRCYNVGGDKNMAAARAAWPKAARVLAAKNLTGGRPAAPVSQFIFHVQKTLWNKDADAVIFANFDLLTSGRLWPVRPEVGAEFRAQHERILSRIEGKPLFHVAREPLFSVVTLSEEGRKRASSRAREP